MHEDSTSTPCSACGSTSELLRCCGYISHVRLFYGASDRGAWALGSDHILKERPAKLPMDEGANLKFLKENTTIPVPKILNEWVDSDGRYFILMERIKGKTLEETWPTMSTADKERIAGQTAEYLLQLRKLQSPQMQSIAGGPVYDAFLDMGSDTYTPHGPISSDDGLWEDMQAAGLEKLPERARASLRKRMPAVGPFTFTHGDLTNVNIIVNDDGNLAGIIDWEWSGFFPAWWEFAVSSMAHSQSDAEWKALLRECMGNQYSEGRQFWRSLWFVHRYPDLDETGQSMMTALLEE